MSREVLSYHSHDVFAMAALLCHALHPLCFMRTSIDDQPCSEHEGLEVDRFVVDPLCRAQRAYYSHADLWFFVKSQDNLWIPEEISKKVRSRWTA